MSFLSCSLRTVSVVRCAKLTAFRNRNCVWGLINAREKKNLFEGTSKP